MGQIACNSNSTYKQVFFFISISYTSYIYLTKDISSMHSTLFLPLISILFKLKCSFPFVRRKRFYFYFPLFSVVFSFLYPFLHSFIHSFSSCAQLKSTSITRLYLCTSIYIILVYPHAKNDICIKKECKKENSVWYRGIFVSIFILSATVLTNMRSILCVHLRLWVCLCAMCNIKRVKYTNKLIHLLCI